jgi:hypothetical protein
MVFQIPEAAGEMLGVPGRFFARSAASADAPTWINQTWRSEGRSIRGWGKGALIAATVRFDDSCSNGHNSFSIAGQIWIPGRRDVEACGCIHDEIAKAFPELVPLIRWHLTSTDGPMHYVGNAVYLAGDRDHRGLRAGETKPLLGPDRKPHFTLRAINAPGVAVSAAHLKVSRDGTAYEMGDTMPLYAIETSHKGEGLPTPPVLVWTQRMIEGEGKPRELDAARRVAVWPDATDAELMAEPDVLRAALEARLPALLAAFRADMDAAGLVWSPSERREA